MMTDKPFHFEYIPQHAEILKAQKHAAGYYFTWRDRYKVWVYLFPLLVLVIGLINFAYSDKAQGFMALYVGQLVAQLLPLILVFVAFRFLGGRLIGWSQKRCTDQLEQKAPLPLVRFTADEDKLQWTNANSGSWLAYEAIERLFLTPTGLGILYNGAVISIPRNGLGSEEQLQAFLSFLLERISKDAQDKSRSDKYITGLLS